MEAIRYILTLTTNNLNITVPDSMVDTEVEVIILSNKKDERPKFNLADYRGVIPKEVGMEWLKHVEEGRNGW